MESYRFRCEIVAWFRKPPAHTSINPVLCAMACLMGETTMNHHHAPKSPEKRETHTIDEAKRIMRDQEKEKNNNDWRSENDSRKKAEKETTTAMKKKKLAFAYTLPKRTTLLMRCWVRVTLLSNPRSLSIPALSLSRPSSTHSFSWCSSPQ